jgi:hypothetical protein
LIGNIIKKENSEMKHYAWPKIGQFRNTVRSVSNAIRYIGKDTDGQAIYDNLISLPTLDFIGTPKLHGTNASVCIRSDGEIWFQSRKNIITIDKDNAGFAVFACHKDKIKLWEKISKNIQSKLDLPDNIDIIIFGEWCGKGIQSGVAISELSKMFVIFGIDIITASGMRHHLCRHDFLECIYGIYDSFDNVFSIEDFGFYEITIDFDTTLVRKILFDLKSSFRSDWI